MKAAFSFVPITDTKANVLFIRNYKKIKQKNWKEKEKNESPDLACVWGCGMDGGLETTPGNASHENHWKTSMKQLHQPCAWSAKDSEGVVCQNVHFHCGFTYVKLSSSDAHREGGVKVLWHSEWFLIGFWCLCPLGSEELVQPPLLLSNILCLDCQLCIRLPAVSLA